MPVVNQIKVEVCAESIGSALTAQQCGAWRVELCDNLSEGGTTPSCGQITEARKRLHIKLYPIIRPRGGDFTYTDEEIAVMQEDIRMCGRLGCDGVVFGILHPDGTVDKGRCAELITLARQSGMDTTFHRAFDVCSNLPYALEDIISLGFERVLTSGGAPASIEGLDTIARLNRQAEGRIIVMPGSGVTPENAETILRTTGCREIHGTFRGRMDSIAYNPGWADYEVWHADPDKIKAVVRVAESLSDNQ